MTKDDILRMAIEAGLFAVPYPHPTNSKEVECFAALIAAAEREEFLKWCDASIEGITPRTDWAKGYVTALKNVAQGFRARGN